MPLAIGQILQYRYFIARMLGRGGMGAVYQATDQRLSVQCAVKETFFTDAYALAQFQREAQLLASLKHPRLPRVTDYFDEGGCYYLVMDYVDGLNGQEWVQRCGPISERQAVTWGDQLLDALAYLHGRKPPIVHRDIKPANVRITSEGAIVLVDFGIAKEYMPGIGTTTGAKVVSPGFSPPEQYVAQGRTDGRTDIYAVGATLYYLLTGLTPPESPRVAMGAPLAPVERANPRAGARIGAVLERAMRLAPEQRWQTADEMRRALRQIAASSPVLPAVKTQTVSKPSPAARPSPPRMPARQTKGGSTLAWIAVGVAVALILIGLLGLLALGLSGAFSNRPRVTPTVTRITQAPLVATSGAPIATLVPTLTTTAAHSITRPPTTPLEEMPTPADAGRHCDAQAGQGACSAETITADGR